MIAFKSLSEILDTMLGWENKLKDFYDVAEYALQNEKSKKTVQTLRERHVNKLEILRGADHVYNRPDWEKKVIDVTRKWFKKKL